MVSFYKNIKAKCWFILGMIILKGFEVFVLSVFAIESVLSILYYTFLKRNRCYFKIPKRGMLLKSLEFLESII